jgi:HEAT repeat protein
MMRQGAFIVVAVAIAIANIAVQTGAGAQDRSSIVTTSFEDTALTKAFEAAKAGDYGPISALPAPSAADVPAIERALSDESEVVRREAVTLLGRANDPAAAPALAGALADPVDDIATRAAAALYRLGPEALDADPAVGEQLRGAVDKGFAAGGAILLLAHAKDKVSTIAVLQALRDTKGESLTEVFLSSPTVPIALMADVSLARLGDSAAEDRLLAAIGNGDLDTGLFLLSALREIDSPRLIETLAAATLADSRPVEGDAPSGAETGVRLADLAATRLVQRFSLPVGIDDTADERFSDETLQAVKAALDQHLAKAQ